MKAGREFDLFIAQEIFGWKLAPPWEPGMPTYLKSSSYKWQDPDGGYYGTPPEFSTDFTEAWDLFLKTMIPNRTSIHPCGKGTYGQDGLWWAVYEDKCMVAHNKTLPMAICIYALKIHGSDFTIEE